MNAQKGYRPQKVHRITGLSPRQLSYWDKTGLLKPSIAQANGRGTMRCYSFQDIVALKAAKGLLDAGLPLKTIRKAVRELRSKLDHTHLCEHSFVTDGRTVFELTNDPGYIVDLCKGGQVTWNLDVSAIEEDALRRARNAERALKMRGCERRPVGRSNNRGLGAI